MNQASVHKKFIFNTRIDSNWLFDMYEDDYAYILEMFGNSLHTIREELPVLASAFDSNDLDQLKKTAHKIKPLFGFAGLAEHQELIARFEVACSSAHDTANLTMQYIELTDALQEGRNILQEEYNRLNDFISL